MQLDTLEIQRIVEEKRLIWGRVLEQTLLKKIALLFLFIGRVIGNKSSSLIAVIFIVATSILVQSSSDIGHDSVTYIEIAKKILNGEKYFDDFFEVNLPLNFVLTTIPVLFAQKFNFNLLAVAQIFWNLLGILSIIYSAKILTRSDLTKDRAIFNLLIISFAAGFFWRVFTLQFGEIGTKTTYLLAILFPYISYFLVRQKELTKTDQFLIGIMAGLLFCLKPHYGIFVISVELFYLFNSRSFKSLFCLRNYVTLTVLSAYLLLLVRYFPDYIENISALSKAYYDAVQSKIFHMFLHDIFPFALLIFICFEVICQKQILLRLFCIFLAAAILILSELINWPDQVFVFYSLALPLIVLTIFFVVKSNLINWRRDFIYLIAILLLPQADSAHIFSLLYYVLCFWWLIALFIVHKWHKILPIRKSALFVLILLASITLILIGKAVYSQIVWLISIFSFALIVYLNQKNHQKYIQKKEFSRLSASLIFLVLSYLLSVNLSTIFNLNYSEYRSPNNYNSELIKNIKYHVSKDQSDVFVNYGIPTIYPAITYAEKNNELPFLQYGILFKQINAKKTLGDNTSIYMMNRIKELLKAKSNKLFLVELTGDKKEQSCAIGLLEYYFRDPEFKKIFVENYVFLTRVSNIVKSNPDLEIIDRDVEIYIRK